MTSPIGVADEVSRNAHADAQAAIDDLYGRLNALKTGVGEEGVPYDDAWAHTEIRKLWAAIEDLDKRVKELERRFPIFRHAIVLEEFENYLTCAFYNPVTDRQVGQVSVAKPWGQRDAGSTTDYTVDDQILIAKTHPYVIDGDNRIVVWEVIGAGGGTGNFVYYSDTTWGTLTVNVHPTEELAFGFGTTDDHFGVWINSQWFCLSHFLYT